jgi:plasmid maintenance system killer protein
LQLEINDNRLKKIINDPNKLIKKVGLEMAKKMHQRFNELRASSNFKQYLDNGIGRPHPLTGNLYNLFGISLNKNYRLIVEPLIDGLDVESLHECKKIEIKGVMDYHDGKYVWLIP